ncbi:MAG: DUF3391 domain-containing protein [Burkholderiales bacterium]|nr:DUF3391 domain-containing protein [Burkholderiales bacterium]
MNDESSLLVDVRQLRIGMYIVLDLGWLSHPFPVNRFRIASETQIEILRDLGLEQVRCIPSLSDDPSLEPADAAVRSDAAGARAAELPTASGAQAPVPEGEAADIDAVDQRLQRQREWLEACDRRFIGATRAYRKLADSIQGSPAQARIESEALVGDCVQELMHNNESVIVLLSEGIGDRQALHPVNVMVLSLLMGKAQGMGTQALQDLGMAALLHDIGKLRLPVPLALPFPGMQPADFERYRSHVGESVVMGKGMGLSSTVLLAMAQHHEMHDGSGFPLRLRGEELCMAGRILGLVNHYERLCNPARAAQGLTPHEALSTMYAQQKSLFDPMVLGLFIRMMGVYPPGSVVQLVNDRYALVVSVNSSRPLRPRVIVYDPRVPRDSALVLDLETCPEIGVRRSLRPSQLPREALEYLSPRQRICYFFERAIDAERAEVFA